MLAIAARLTLYVLFVLMLQAAPQSSVVRGVAIESESRRPVAKVSIELRNSETGQALYAATTDENGRFILPAARPGRYRLTAARSGFVSTEYGQQAPGLPGLPITVSAGATPFDLEIPMTRTASISGRITNSGGLPLPNTEVQALKISYQEGRRVLTVAQSVRANDLGEYRLFWLPPGRYFVSGVPMNPSPWGSTVVMNPSGPQPGFSVSGYLLPNNDTLLPEGVFSFGVRSSATEAYVPVYFPGTTNEETAAAIELLPGQDYRGGDIVLTPVRPRTIRGVVMDGSANRPATGAQILRSRVPPSGNSYFIDGVDSAKGTFEIPNVVPGKYSLMAVSGTISGRVEVEVRDRDIDDLAITMKEGLMLPGRVVIQGSANTTRTGMASLRVHLRPVPAFPGRIPIYGSLDEEGLFTLSMIPPGDYRVLVEPFEPAPTVASGQRGAASPGGGGAGQRGTTPQGRGGVNALLRGTPSAVPLLLDALKGAYIQSIRLGNRDISSGELRLDSPSAEALEIVIATNAGLLQGGVANAPNVTVVLVPNPPLRPRVDLYKTATTDAAGKFLITDVAPGNYKAFAWRYVESGAWLDAEFMQNHEDRGVPVPINETSSSTIELTLIR